MLDGFPSSWPKLIPPSRTNNISDPVAKCAMARLFYSNRMDMVERMAKEADEELYALINQSYKEYKDKLKELYGEEAHNAIVDSIVSEKCKDVYISSPSFISSSSLDFGEGMEPEIIRTFYDSFSQRYFETTIAKVIEAEYHLNRNFMFQGVIPLNDFYEFLGLEKTEFGETVGWSSCNGDIYWIDFNHHKLTLEDGMEIFVIDMVFEPTAEWMEDL